MIYLQITTHSLTLRLFQKPVFFVSTAGGKQAHCRRGIWQSRSALLDLGLFDHSKTQPMLLRFGIDLQSSGGEERTLSCAIAINNPHTGI